MNKSILITDKVHPILISELEQDGYKIDYRPNILLQETHKLIPAFHGIMINSKIICDKSLIDKAKNLEFIGRLGSGLEIIDLDYAYKRGIKVVRTPEANCDSVAEHALGMILSLFNNLPKASRQLQNLNWQREQNRGFELRAKTVGIIGMGHTGTSFANLLKPFGVHLLCYDKYRPGYNDENILTEILDRSEIISLHLPLTDETIHYVNEEFIGKNRNPFYLINTARGENVKTEDLLNALDNGMILGACLDVFENEKPENYSPSETEMYSNLMNRSNVICTPHVAGWTIESLERMAFTMLEKIRDLT